MQTDTDRSTLKVILFADLHDYSRLVAFNEIRTLAFVQDCFRLFRDETGNFGGEFVKTTGDGVLILFDSVTRAIGFSIHIQDRLRGLSLESSEGGRFRIGLHMGEVFRNEGDAFGHAINLAARLEGVAEPGGICVSQDVYRAAHQNFGNEFRSGGRIALKNIPEPVSIYHSIAPGVVPQDQRNARCHISTIDGLSLLTDDGDRLTLKSGKARALIGVLALSGRLQESQERLAALLWPEHDHTEARKALGRCVARIEKALSAMHFASLGRHGDSLSFNSSLVDVDLSVIQNDLDVGKVHDLLLQRPDWPESILLGLDDASPLFKAWLRVTRRNWRERVCGLLENVLDRFEPGEQAVRNAAGALLLAEPCHERAAQLLIRHYSEIGNHSAALRVYDSLCQEMSSRFSLQPGPETVNLMQGLKSNRPALPRPGAPAGGRARRPAIAVGPFEARSEALRDSAFGFRADLIANLSCFREWTIIESAAGETAPGSDYLVTGACTELKDGIEFRVLLERSESREVLWSEVFRLTANSWDETQRIVVSRIASSLEIYISHDRLSRTLREHASHDVYDAWVRGEHLLIHWKREAEEEAARLFRSVIRQDPEFAPAYASLASVYSSRHLVQPGIKPDQASMQKSLELSGRAIDLDPLNARAQLTVAWANAMVGRFSQAEVHYRLATELNPNSPKVLISAALGLAFQGITESAKLLMDRAVALSPILLDYQWSYIAVVRYFLGDYRGCIEAAERSKNVIPDTPGWNAAAFLQLGQHGQAASALADLHRITSAEWYGQVPASTQAALDWFLDAFPIRHDADRERLNRLRELIRSD